MAYIGLDATQHERTAGTGKSTPLPPGMYHGIITRTTMKETGKDKPESERGQMLEVEFDITYPSAYGNRKFWDKFNIINKNPTAVKIAKEQLSDLVKATGLSTLQDDADLQGKEVALVLRVQESTNPKYPGPSNECSKYWPVGTSMDQHEEWRKSGKKALIASSGAVAPTIPASSAPKAPWARK